MDKSQSQSAALDQLLMLMVEDELDSEQRVQLEKLLRDDPAAQRTYARYVALHAWLDWEAPLDDMAVAPKEITQASPLETPATSSTTRLLGAGILSLDHWRAHPVRFSGLTLALTGVIWALFVFWVLPWRAQQQQIAGLDDSVEVAATIKAMEEVEWAADSIPWRQGSQLLAGRTLDLKSGVVEIEFASKARAVIEGPALFRIDDSDGGYLNLGKLYARATRGFTIVTDAATIVDLGTEFGVEVDRQGHTETHVYQGRIEVRRGDERIELAAGEAIRIAGAQLVKAKAAESLFRTAAASRPPAAAIAWGPATDVTGPDDLLTEGELVAAVNLGMSRASIREIEFQPENSLGNVQRGMLNGHSTGDVGLNALLDEVGFGGGGLNTIAISGLTPGANYKIQVFYCDGRPQTARRPMTVATADHPESQITLTNRPILTGKGPFGQFAVGQFVAEQSTLTLVVHTKAAANAHLNAYLIRQVNVVPDVAPNVTEPSM